MFLIWMLFWGMQQVFGEPVDSSRNTHGGLLGMALENLNMNTEDLWLPTDVIPRDSFRLPLMDSLFDKPLGNFELPRQLKLNKTFDQQGVLQSAQALLNLKYRSPSPTSLKQDRALKGASLKKIIKKLRGQPFWKIWGPLIVKSIRVSAELKEMQTMVPKKDFNLLISEFDSLLLNSEEIEKLNVYELKEAEIEDHKKAVKLFQLAQQIYVSDFTQRGTELYHLLWQSIRQTSTQKSPTEKSLTASSSKIREFTTPQGTIALGTMGDDIYKKDYLFILDPGGNDTYLLKNKSKQEALQSPLHIIVDLGGNDLYRGGDFSLGGAYWGISLLIDTQGDDVYYGGNFSLGSALFGMGVLHDVEGNDTYKAKGNTQGAGAFGLGLLVDEKGSDSYTCETQSQGFGFTRGVGLLYDSEGNDHYVTASPIQDFLRYDNHFISFSQGAGLGYRPIASGGVGILFDASGKDSYLSDIFGQGTGYWFSLGLLLDGSGDDSYSAYQYSQGAGVHLAHGVLWDKQGNDHYHSHGVSQGCGHDIAFGSLRDDSGNDVYYAFGLSQGGGNANAISLFTDLQGDDTYSIRTLYNSMGYSDLRRDYGMIGIFADGGGHDLYSDTSANNQTTLKSSLGVFLDVDNPSVDTKKFQEQVNESDETTVKLSSTLDSLFVQASAAPQKFRIHVGPAREAIIARGSSALSFLAGKLGTVSAREQHALRAIFKGLSESAYADVARLVADSVNSQDRKTKLKSAEICGRNQIKECIPSLKNMLGEANPNYRASGALNLGRIKEKSLNEFLIKYLQDEHPYVVMRVAWGLGHNGLSAKSEALTSILNHPRQLVRNGFLQGLLKGNPQPSLSWVTEALKASSTDRGKKTLVQLIPYAPETSESKKLFKKIFSGLKPGEKSHLKRCIAGSQSQFWKKQLKKWAP